MPKFFATFLIAVCAIPTWADACFDDKKLAELLLQPARGSLVYVWSPRMVLSAQHAASAQQQARLQGLGFVALHDAQVPAAELQAARERLRTGGDTRQAQSALSLVHSQPLCASSLLERDALRHFPSAFVVQPSGVHRHPIVGAMPDAAWASSIAQRLDVQSKAGGQP
jgi:hypothetical protein